MPNCCPGCVQEMYGGGIDPATLALSSLSVNYKDDSDVPCSLNDDVATNYIGVYVLPGASDYTLYRRKWNYVKNLYNAGYTIDSSGDPTDTRDEYFTIGECSPDDTPNAAYWLDYNRYQAEFYSDLFNWTMYAQSRPTHAAIFERWLQWKNETGTVDIYGNLPQHKKNSHVGHCWMLCPYDSNTSIERTIALLGATPPEGRNDHGVYYMKTASRGSVWGFECTSPTCPYFTTYSGIYFYS